jgi:hypothetical protein
MANASLSLYHQPTHPPACPNQPTNLQAEPTAPAPPPSPSFPPSCGKRASAPPRRRAGRWRTPPLRAARFRGVRRGSGTGRTRRSLRVSCPCLRWWCLFQRGWDDSAGLGSRRFGRWRGIEGDGVRSREPFSAASWRGDTDCCCVKKRSVAAPQTTSSPPRPPSSSRRSALSQAITQSVASGSVWM